MDTEFESGEGCDGWLNVYRFFHVPDGVIPDDVLEKNSGWARVKSKSFRPCVISGQTHVQHGLLEAQKHRVRQDFEEAYLGFKP
jgi:hypothetical protein